MTATMIVLAVAGVVAVAVMHRSDKPEQSRRLAAAPTAPTSLEAEIAAFRRPPTAADTVPSVVRHGRLFQDGIIDFTSARRVGTDTTRRWIARSADGRSVCTFSLGEMACALDSVITQRGADAGVFWHADTLVRVNGVATDAVHQITVELRNGEKATVPVIANTFSYECAQVPASISWRGPHGPVRVIVPSQLHR